MIVRKNVLSLQAKRSKTAMDNRQNDVNPAGNPESMHEMEMLREAVEKSVGRKLRTPKDFDQLSSAILARLGVMLSRNTLRRIWGNMQDVAQPRKSTLDFLARFLGYSGMDAFREQAGKEIGDTSNSIMGRKIYVSTDLRKGDRLRLTWLPDRVCDVEYSGSMHFCVTSSENTKIKTGDTFLCGIIIEGEPLYVDEWQHGDNAGVAYVCGKKGGVRFERL